MNKTNVTVGGTDGVSKLLRPTFRVPIVDVKLDPHQTGDPAGHFRGATIVVDEAWVKDALSPVPTGNGTPGGTFLSTFRVAAVREDALSAAGYISDRDEGV
jgi:hypothetical protein